MKKIIASGMIAVNIVENTFTNKQNEEITYKRLELPLSEETTETLELQAPSSYELLKMKLVSTPDKKSISKNNDLIVE